MQQSSEIQPAKQARSLQIGFAKQKFLSKGRRFFWFVFFRRVKKMNSVFDKLAFPMLASRFISFSCADLVEESQWKKRKD